VRRTCSTANTQTSYRIRYNNGKEMACDIRKYTNIVYRTVMYNGIKTYDRKEII
jgi:hypothetical protein